MADAGADADDGRVRRPAAAGAGFTAVELLVVVSILVLLSGLVYPLVTMLKESARRQQAHAIIAQISDAVFEYQGEDPHRAFPAQEPDLFIRMDPNNATVHLLNLLTAMQLDGGLLPRVHDPADNGTLVLVDPWKRPYRYQLDDPGGLSPTQAASATRPDPAKLDWNAKGFVPFAYVWSLGAPVHGASGLWQADPDAVPGSGAAWIYPATSP